MSRSSLLEYPVMWGITLYCAKQGGIGLIVKLPAEIASLILAQAIPKMPQEMQSRVRKTHPGRMRQEGPVAASQDGHLPAGGSTERGIRQQW